MPRVRLQYFALLRESAGRSDELRQTDATTLRELYDELRHDYGFSLEAERIRAAVGEQYVALDTAVAENMEITFIPPVAGG